MSKPVAFALFGISLLFLSAGFVILFNPPSSINFFFIGYVFSLMLFLGLGFSLLSSTFTTLSYPLHFASFTSTSLKLAGIGFSGGGLGFLMSFALNFGGIFSLLMLLLSALFFGTAYELFTLAFGLRRKEIYNLNFELEKRRV